MNSQQKKLAVATGFFVFISTICLVFYFQFLRPLHLSRLKSGTKEKYTLKRAARTQFNPEYIDSIVKERKKAAEKKNP
jgi:dolichol kinase